MPFPKISISVGVGPSPSVTIANEIQPSAVNLVPLFVPASAAVSSLAAMPDPAVISVNPQGEPVRFVTS